MSAILSFLESVGANADLRHASKESWASVSSGGSLADMGRLFEQIALKDSCGMVPMIMPFSDL